MKKPYLFLSLLIFLIFLYLLIFLIFHDVNPKIKILPRTRTRLLGVPKRSASDATLALVELPLLLHVDVPRAGLAVLHHGGRHHRHRRRVPQAS